MKTQTASGARTSAISRSSQNIGEARGYASRRLYYITHES